MAVTVVLDRAVVRVALRDVMERVIVATVMGVAVNKMTALMVAVVALAEKAVGADTVELEQEARRFVSLREEHQTLR